MLPTQMQRPVSKLVSHTLTSSTNDLDGQTRQPSSISSPIHRLVIRELLLTALTIFLHFLLV